MFNNSFIMRKKYKFELEKIEQFLGEYYENDPFNEQTNRAIKNKIKELIIVAHDDTTLSGAEKQTVINAALTLLAENTGCVEDCEILESIFHELFDKRKIINQKDIDDLYKNSPVNRWL